MQKQTAKQIALRVSVITIAVNFLLASFKLIAGILGKSSAMISDAVHSASDVFATVIVIIGVIISNKPTDEAHRYGHERLECVASLILSIILFGTGGIIGYTGVVRLINGSYKSLTKPKTIALVASILSIVVKEGMFWYTYIVAKKINSLSLKANAWHHRSDALSSIGSLIGILGAMLFDLPILDVIASIIICIFIVKVSVQIFLEAINKMVDKSCPEEKINEMKDLLIKTEGVVKVDDIKTRMFGNKIYVDIEISADQNLPFIVAHGIAEKAHHEIENYDKNIKHCMVHVNPVDVDKLKSEQMLNQ